MICHQVFGWVRSHGNDVQVHVRVTIPARPNKEEVQLVEKLRDLHEAASKRPSFGGFKF